MPFRELAVYAAPSSTSVSLARSQNAVTWIDHQCGAMVLGRYLAPTDSRRDLGGVQRPGRTGPRWARSRKWS